MSLLVRFLDAYYHRGAVAGTAITNAMICAYYDTMYGVSELVPISEDCRPENGEHVFFGSAKTYGIRPVRMGAYAAASVAVGPLSIPLHIYYRTTANARAPNQGMMDTCVCGERTI